MNCNENCFRLYEMLQLQEGNMIMIKYQGKDKRCVGTGSSDKNTFENTMYLWNQDCCWVLNFG